MQTSPSKHLRREACHSIAAIALTHDLTHFIHNALEFSRVSSLRLEDWESSSDG